VPLATGRELIRQARDVGMHEYAFVSAALIIGGKSISKSKELIENLTQEQAARFAELAIRGSDVVPGRAGRKLKAARKAAAKKK